VVERFSSNIYQFDPHFAITSRVLIASSSFFASKQPSSSFRGPFSLPPSRAFGVHAELLNRLPLGMSSDAMRRTILNFSSGLASPGLFSA